MLELEQAEFSPAHFKADVACRVPPRLIVFDLKRGLIVQKPNKPQYGCCDLGLINKSMLDALFPRCLVLNTQFVTLPKLLCT